MQDTLTGSAQENLLTLLCFDKSTAPIIANTLQIELFENEYFREIARYAIHFYESFKDTPNEHIADLLEDKINDAKNPRTGDVYKKIVMQLFENRSNVNSVYVMSELVKFVRQQRMKIAIIEASKHIKDHRLDEAETVLESSLKAGIDIFDKGFSITDLSRSLAFLRRETFAFPTGIPQLDKEEIGPAPGELFVILAGPNKGKSHFLIHIGKTCVRSRLKVLHISLEMSDDLVSERYMQSFFALSKRQGAVELTRFRFDELQKLNRFEIEELTRPHIRGNPEIASLLTKELKRYEHRFKLIIKRFPTGALTVKGLESYLDSLERFENYVPDVVLLDYADLMKLDYQNLRTSTGEIYKELRRIAVERNFAMVTASQSNRLGEDSKVISLKHLAEDFSKAATADNIIAFCQTSTETKMSLARLFVAKARNEKKDQSVLLSQAYGIGQFCMDSTLVNDRYWTLIDRHNETDTPPEEGGETPPLRARRNVQFTPRRRSD